MRNRATAVGPAKPVVTSLITHQVAGHDRVDATVEANVGPNIIAVFEFTSDDREVFRLCTLTIRAVDPALGKGVTSTALHKISVKEARWALALALMDTNEKLALEAREITSPGAPSKQDILWLRRAVEFVAADRRDHRDVYREMQKVFPGKSEAALSQWVATLRRKKKYVTPHPMRELTSTAKKLVRQHAIQPMVPR